MVVFLVCVAVALVVAAIGFLIIRLSPTKRLDPHDEAYRAEQEARALMTSQQARGAGGFGRGI